MKISIPTGLSRIIDRFSFRTPILKLIKNCNNQITSNRYFQRQVWKTASGKLLKNLTVKSVVKGALQSRCFTKSRGKQPCRSLFFNKVVAWSPVFLSKKRLGTGVFLCIFAKFSKTTFYRTFLTTGSNFKFVKSLIKMRLRLTWDSCQYCDDN